jgi:hypothetical protein
LVSRTGRRGGAIVAAALAGAMAFASPVAATSTPFNTNLVKNGGAENGLIHWDTFPDGDFQTHAYGKAGLGFPSKATSNNIGGGSRFFYAGLYDNAYGTCGDAQEQFTLTGLNSAIDGGHVKVRFRGYAATNGAASMNAHLDLYFRDANNHSVSSNGITKTATSTNELYKHYDVTKLLPRNTRILRVHLWADGDATSSSGDCAAFWDKISVVLLHA